MTAVWVALIGPEEEENLALRYLAAALGRAGFETAIIPFNSADAMGSVLQATLDSAHKKPPVLVAISLAFQWRAKDCLALAMALRERSYTGHITTGGHFGTFAARELLRDFAELDSVCLYEAERTIVDLARTVSAGGSIDCIAGLAYRKADSVVLNPLDNQQDLRDLPWPDRRGEPTNCLGHPMAPLVSGRGCYANCAFCCIAAWHGMAGGSRFRLRPVDDVADEMCWLNRQRGIEIFIFHDDNFFLPGHRQSLERITTLADALDARDIGPFATVVKARPTDVTPEIFQAMRDRLGCIRTFLGIENASEQGLQTLQRRVRADENPRAMQVLRELGIWICFNMLIFDPDTTIESLETNLSFVEQQPDYPFNFGRVELYAGTPLLARLQEEKRCWGDYLGHDYRMASPQMEQIFRIAMQCLHQRVFAGGALANRLQAVRLEVEVARRFHPDIYRESWLPRVADLCSRLGRDSAAGLREIIQFVSRGGRDSRQFVMDLSARLRAVEDQVGQAATSLENEMAKTIGVDCWSAGGI